MSPNPLLGRCSLFSVVSEQVFKMQSSQLCFISVMAFQSFEQCWQKYLCVLRISFFYTHWSTAHPPIVTLQVFYFDILSVWWRHLPFTRSLISSRVPTQRKKIKKWKQHFLLSPGTREIIYGLHGKLLFYFKRLNSTKVFCSLWVLERNCALRIRQILVKWLISS